MISQVLNKLDLADGATSILILFLVVFSMVLAWNFRKKARNDHLKISKLPLED